MTDPSPILIRIGSSRHRTFHTHGIPLRSERAESRFVVVSTWSRSRPILARVYLDMRAFGLTGGQARSCIVDPLLVAS